GCRSSITLCSTPSGSLESRTTDSSSRSKLATLGSIARRPARCSSPRARWRSRRSNADMTRRSLTMVLGMTLLGTGCWGTHSEEPPIHIVHNMDQQERGDPQDRNDFFADHRFMRKPPEGTVAVGLLKDDDHLHRGIGPDGKISDELPASLDLNEALLDRGRERYGIYC